MGTKKNAAAVALGRRNKGATSERKKATSAANGRLGGRPPKFTAGDRVVILPGAPAALRGLAGTVRGRGAVRATFTVTVGHKDHPIRTWHLRLAHRSPRS